MTVRIGVAIDRRAQHLADVSYEFEPRGGSATELVLPSWVPGSYAIRPFARNLRELRATTAESGAGIVVERLDKARWRLATSGNGTVRVRYSVYGHDLSTSALDVTDEHLFLNAAVCLPYLEGRKEEPYELALHLPADWQIFTELSEAGRAPPVVRASNYDELVDEPVDCGRPTVLTASAVGVPHRLVICGQGGNFEPHRLETDLGRIAEATARLFGGLPFKRYTYFLHLGERGGGGLEHRNSTSIVVPRTTFRPESDYLRFLNLCSHEYFHLFNVKRIRPKVLGPFDYTRENYTHLLWAMEGTTDFYGPLLVRRAGLVTPSKYLEGLAGRVRAYRETPGRLVTPVEMASFSTWIDHYQPYEESINQSVSYYLKGGLVSGALDLELRHRTDNRVSLDSVYGTLWTDYGAKERGLEEGELLEVAERVSGLDLHPFFARYISGTDELDLTASLRLAGLELAPKERPNEPGDDAEPGYLGIELEEQRGLARIRLVRDASPGRRAGLSPGDEIVALDGSRVVYGDLPAALKRYPAGSALRITVFRRGRLTELEATTGAGPPEKLKISPVAEPTELERRIYEGWIGSSWEPRKPAPPP